MIGHEHGRAGKHARACAGAGAAALCAALAAPAAGQANAGADSAAVVAAVARFHAALAAGDSAAALALLDSGVVILESGGAENLAEYRAHHLPADIAFAGAVASQRRVLAVTVRGDAAWVAATSTASGTFRDRPVDSLGAELIVLVRSGGDWKIAAIHWSSRARRR